MISTIKSLQGHLWFEEATNTKLGWNEENSKDKNCKEVGLHKGGGRSWGSERKESLASLYLSGFSLIPLICALSSPPSAVPDSGHPSLVGFRVFVFTRKHRLYLFMSLLAMPVAVWKWGKEVKIGLQGKFLFLYKLSCPIDWFPFLIWVQHIRCLSSMFLSNPYTFFSSVSLKIVPSAILL
jgi:hypothetical protein